MPRVFLSYAREDAERAQIIAHALEKAGHSVWWDQVIRAGAQFSIEIEQALNDADAVVVLWSEHSIDSPWVRDEAAMGRDNGQLVPVLIGRVQPPMGFRQFQSIDLARWNGRPGSAQLQKLFKAIADRAAPGQSPSPVEVLSPRQSRPRPWHLIAAALALLGLVGGLTVWSQSQGSPPIPLVAVIPADASPGPKAWARDLLVKLASLQEANADALRLLDQSTDTRPDLIFEIAGNMQGNNPEASLLLRDGGDRSILWSKDFQKPGTTLADLRQQVAYTAAQVLSCSLEGLNADRPLDPQVLKLYLNACSALAAGETGRDLKPLFTDITNKAPSFQGAWAKLLKLEAWQAAWAADGRNLLPSLKRHVAEARKLNPHMPEVYIADIELLPGAPLLASMRLLDQAVLHNPTSSEALFQRSILLMQVGRIADALADARGAT
jgi:hypothetical protein